MSTINLFHGNYGGRNPDAIGDISKYSATGNAEPTSRVLDGSDDHGAAEEWAEPGLYDGKPCRAIYLFDDEDITDLEGDPLQEEDYPWNTAHMARIILDDEE